MKRGIGTLAFAAAFAVLVVGGILIASGFGRASESPAPSTTPPLATPAGSGGGVQDVYLKALDTGLYDEETLTVEAGRPVRLHFSAENYAGCGKGLLLRDFGVSLVSRNGEEQIAEFTPNKQGTYEYSCSMRMFRGTLQVK